MTTHFELHKGQHPGWLSDEDRPAWLGDGERIAAYYSHIERWADANNNTVSERHWPLIITLRFEAPYWAIPALKAGYRPWAGGDKAPGDYAGGAIIFSDGYTCGDEDEPWDWSRTCLGHPIIGYMPATPKPDTGKTYPPELVALKDLLTWAEIQVCPHEETHRGGVLWEICDSCGAKWADDEGGRPDFEWPEPIEKARAIMAEIDPPQVDPLEPLLDDVLRVWDGHTSQDGFKQALAILKRGLKTMEADNAGH